MAPIRTLGEPPSAAVITEAVAVLRNGLVVAVPTDTVYGLAADPFHAGATERIFEAKQRPRDVELPVLVADTDQALSLCAEEAVPDTARRLMTRFWPGALTLVLARRPGLAADLGSDDATVGIRCPSHVVVRALCARVGPLATTSANRHRGVTPVAAKEIADLFGDSIDLVLDGGDCAGSPSTVLDCTGIEPKLLREGRIPWAEIRACLDAGG